MAAHGATGARNPRFDASLDEGPSRQRRPNRRRQRNTVAAVGMLAPTVAMLLLLRILPGLNAVWDSTHRSSLLSGTSRFVGLGNFDFLLHSEGFHRTLGVTLLFALLVNPIQILLALGLAVLLNERLPGRGVWRTAVFLPIAVPAAASAVIWGVAMRPDGPMNAMLGFLGLPPQPFLTSPAQALPSIIVVLTWIGVGYWMIFLIAGLNDIPQDYYEAASLDGASKWQRFWHVTLPSLRRPLAFVLVADTVANFTVFAPVQILTNGGPQGSTNLLIYDTFQQAFVVGDANVAAAEVLVLLLMMLGIVILQFRLLGREG